MQGEVQKRIIKPWQEASDEQDPKRFREIVREMNLRFQEKQDRLDKGATARSGG